MRTQQRVIELSPKTSTRKHTILMVMVMLILTLIGILGFVLLRPAPLPAISVASPPSVTMQAAPQKDAQIEMLNAEIAALKAQKITPPTSAVMEEIATPSITPSLAACQTYIILARRHLGRDASPLPHYPDGLCATAQGDSLRDVLTQITQAGVLDVTQLNTQLQQLKAASDNTQSQQFLGGALSIRKVTDEPGSFQGTLETIRIFALTGQYQHAVELLKSLAGKAPHAQSLLDMLLPFAALELQLAMLEQQILHHHLPLRDTGVTP